MYKNVKKIIFLITVLAPYLTSFSSETDAYDFSWLDPDKKVYVLQNRKYRKVGRAHINLGIGKTTSGAFVDATSLQGRFGYFFTENWGFEFLYAKNNGDENDTFMAVKNNNGSSATPFRRIVDNYMGFMVLWSPFYAKFNTFNKIIYMDWILGAGLGKLEESNNRNAIQPAATGTELDIIESHTTYVWGMGLKFYLSEIWNVRADLTGVHYSAQKAISQANSNDKQWYTNFDATLSIGINF